MAAEPQPKALTRKPLLLNKVEGSQEVVNMAAIVPKEDGVISVSEDRYWKRASGGSGGRGGGLSLRSTALGGTGAPAPQGPEWCPTTSATTSTGERRWEGTSCAVVVRHHRRRVTVVTDHQHPDGTVRSPTGARAKVRVPVVQLGDTDLGSRIRSWRRRILEQESPAWCLHRCAGQGSDWTGTLLKLEGLE
ncbi:hypothetical protein BTVI_90729 [Pitangus sulphuratus]|nr:hypothetical protein BTVI_90729 [Pitangus sulphuratus]